MLSSARDFSSCPSRSRATALGELPRTEKELAGALLDFAIAAAQLERTAHRAQPPLRVGGDARLGGVAEELARLVEELRALAPIGTSYLLPQRRIGPGA